MKTTTTAALALLALALPVLGKEGPEGKGKAKGKGKCHPHPPLKPLVSSEALQADITLEGLRADAEKLQSIADANGGTRVFGSAGHNSTVDWIYNTLKATGHYNVYKQPFVEQYSEGDAIFTVNGKEVTSQIMTYTPSGTVTGGKIVVVNNLGCVTEDYPAEVAGSIALIKRGECSFANKALNANAAGALGAVVYNNAEGIVAGTLGAVSPDYAPIVGISQADGEAIIAALAAGDVEADLDVYSLIEERVNYNVIAETIDGDHGNVLVVGAHSDSVKAGPGINDDGSGSIGILNVALALPKYKINNAVRFSWWGAEEFGKLGSYYYIKQVNQSETELAKLRAYLNFDMIASPNYIHSAYDGDGSTYGLVGPAGSDVIEKDFQDFYKANGFETVPKAFDGRSDYAAFIENGVPAGGIFTGAEEIKSEEEARLFGGVAGVALDANYHAIGDTIDNLAWDAFLLNAKNIANSVAKYALSWDSLPKVNVHKRRYSGDITRSMKMARDAQPHKHQEGHGPCGGEEKASI